MSDNCQMSGVSCQILNIGIEEVEGKLADDESKSTKNEDYFPGMFEIRRFKKFHAFKISQVQNVSKVSMFGQL